MARTTNSAPPPDWYTRASQQDVMYSYDTPRTYIVGPDGEARNFSLWDEEKGQLKYTKIGDKFVKILPAGASQSEMEKKEPNTIWVKPPEKFTRGKGTSEKDRKEGFYNASGKSIGTTLGTGDYKGGGGSGPNTSQTNWSNYVGDRPNERKIGSSYYEDSSAWSSRGTGKALGRTGTGKITAQDDSEFDYQRPKKTKYPQRSSGGNNDNNVSWYDNFNRSLLFPNREPDYWSNYY